MSREVAMDLRSRNLRYLGQVTQCMLEPTLI
jgi:hypothetical protein